MLLLKQPSRLQTSSKHATSGESEDPSTGLSSKHDPVILEYGTKNFLSQICPVVQKLSMQEQACVLVDLLAYDFNDCLELASRIGFERKLLLGLLQSTSLQKLHPDFFAEISLELERISGDLTSSSLELLKTSNQEFWKSIISSADTDKIKDIIDEHYKSLSQFPLE